MSLRVFKAGILALMGMCLVAAPTAMASTDPEMGTARWIASTAFHENANACMWAGIPKDLCQAAYRSAYRQHLRVAPAYRDLAACEKAFAAGECVVSARTDLWSPWLAGFSLITQAQLPVSTLPDYRASHEQMASINKSWWQHLQGSSQSLGRTTQVRYFSEPLYWERDHQGGVRLTTLREKVRDGSEFDGAVPGHISGNSQSSPGFRQRARSYEPQRLIDVSGS